MALDGIRAECDICELDFLSWLVVQNDWLHNSYWYTEYGALFDTVDVVRPDPDSTPNANAMLNYYSLVESKSAKTRVVRRQGSPPATNGLIRPKLPY